MAIFCPFWTPSEPILCLMCPFCTLPCPFHALLCALYANFITLSTTYVPFCAHSVPLLCLSMLWDPCTPFLYPYAPILCRFCTYSKALLHPSVLLLYPLPCSTVPILRPFSILLCSLYATFTLLTQSYTPFHTIYFSRKLIYYPEFSKCFSSIKRLSTTKNLKTENY